MQKDDLLNIQYHKFVLGNGIKCIIYPRNEIHSVTVQVNVNVGSLDETEKTNGLSHFIEHVVHDGTKELPTWDAIDSYVNQYSGSTNAYTSLDHTKYYGTFPYQYFEQALFYLSQVSLHPLLKPSDIDKEREIILDELRGSEDEIEYKIIRNIKENRFIDSKTPYSYEIIGTKNNLEVFTKQEFENFYETHYIPDNMEIYIVGNVDITNAKTLLNKYFYNDVQHKQFKEKSKRLFKFEKPEYAGFKINVSQKLDIDQYYLTLDFPSFAFSESTSEDRYKLGFVRSITATSQYFQSVLWKRLREELGIVYDVRAWTYDMLGRSVTAVQTAFNQKHLETVIKEIHDGIRKIKTKDIEETVFKAKQKRTLDTQLMQLDRPENILSWINSYEDELSEHGRGLMIGDYLKFVENLKFHDIIETANKTYDWDMAQIGIVSKDDPIEVKKKVEEIWNKVHN